MTAARYWSNAMRIISMFIALLSLCACASGRYIASPSAPPPDLGITAVNEDLSVALHYLVIPTGPGSWVKDAKWDEYIGSVRNLSKESLVVENIRLIDPRGVYIESEVNPWQLEKASERLIEQYAETGIGVALSVASAASTVLWPVAVVGAPLYRASTEYATVKDREDIEREFNRRRLATFTLAGGATITGSAFFPTVPSPRALVLDYRQGDRVRQLEVSLEKLIGLHVAPPPEGEKKQGQ